MGFASEFPDLWVVVVPNFGSYGFWFRPNLWVQVPELWVFASEFSDLCEVMFLEMENSQRKSKVERLRNSLAANLHWVRDPS